MKYLEDNVIVNEGGVVGGYGLPEVEVFEHCVHVVWSS